MSSLDGTPGCRCNRPLIDLTGVCRVCGKERLHVLPKVAFTATVLPPADEPKDAA